MKNELQFKVPFTGFCSTTFISCFTAVYMFLENLAVESGYDCKRKDGLQCDDCGNCQKQDRYFFVFDTMCGHSSLRCRFDGEPTEMERLICEAGFYDGGTDDNIDFLFGYAGYEYRKLVTPAEFESAIAASVNAGKPVIAKVKTGEDRFRVIIGYDDGALIGPDYDNAQRKPEAPLTYGEIDAIYVFGGKTEPRFGVLDGLERIRRIKEYNIKENLWGGYTEKMGLYTADSLRNADENEKKARMKRVAETMWHTFNCHNFAEVFRNDYIAELCDPALAAPRKKIGGPCFGYTHDLAWALIGLEACADWSKHAAGYFGEMVELTLSQIAKNDVAALEAVNEIISFLKNKK